MDTDPPDPRLESTSAPGIICLHGVFLALRVPPVGGGKPRCIGPVSQSLPASMPEGTAGCDFRASAASAASAPSLGVLILGSAGIGKSELALDLISRGHALVADDSPVFTPQADGRWLGRCPAPLQDFLEVRGLGILNIRCLFGEQAICAEHPLDLVIRLEETSSAPSCFEDRLEGAWRDYRLGGHIVPELPLSARVRRNLALLVETAARLRACGTGKGIGYNAADELSRRLGEHLDKESV
ncbi:MAG: hypothetical protein ABWU16_05065 [Halothiobacillaceae bacterium]